MTAPGDAGAAPAPWWRSGVVYQVYPRSFADGNGDGTGDLAGIRSHLDELADLGVDAIWLSPFYPSPLADGGYDITDYRDVDPRFGTLADFDALAADAHRLGLRVIVDVVPNHTSDEHPWFVEALASPPGSAARDRYIFRNGTGPGGALPPSDWMSHFGGPAWERVADGQWYCHLFAPEQPDLNWANEEVRAYFRGVLRFWADRGVDGFRVDAAHTLAKDLAEPLRSHPSLSSDLPLDGSSPLYDRDEVHEIYADWRRVLDTYDPPLMAVAETWHPANERSRLYARPTELGQVFDFSLLKSEWNPPAFRAVIDTTLAAGDGYPTWVLSNHDVPRHASRLALPAGTDLDAWLLSDGMRPPVDERLAARRARAAALLLLALPGSAYLYQGEELGLLEVADLPRAVLEDPTWRRSGGRYKGRDGARVPLPWTADGPSFGFGADGAWLPQPEWFGRYARDAQRGVAGSTLELYRDALRLRRELVAAQPGGFAWLPSPAGVLAFRRGDRFACVVNMSDAACAAHADADVLLTSAPLDGGAVPPDAAVWFRPSPSRRATVEA